MPAAPVTHCGLMADPPSSEKHRGALRYEVQLTGHPPDWLRADHPDMVLRTVPAQTALRRRVEHPQDLDALLREIGTVGLTVTGVHRAGTHKGQPHAPRGTGAATYEVRVVGELGRPLLRHLRCTHYSVPQLTLVRLTATAAELTRFLHACIDAGVKLEQVRRLAPAPDGRAAVATG